MRKLITIVEAKAPAPIQHKSAAETYEFLKMVAGKITRHPIDIQFLSTWSDSLRAVIIEKKRKYDALDAEDRTYPFDAHEVAMDEAFNIYSYGVLNTFSNVAAAVKDEIRDYQKHQGAKMDAEAGYESDFNYIESSDWLDAMGLQANTGNKLKFARVSTLDDIARIAETINEFCDDWSEVYRTDQGQEASLVEEMTLGLQNVIPFLMFVVKTAIR